jgi:hypothetical protein
VTPLTTRTWTSTRFCLTHIGHSGVQITDKVYGHFASEARKAEVEKLEGAFVV